MKNIDIRQEIEHARIRHYELAKALGVHETTLSRWLRDDLPADKKEQILNAIRTFK